jgi:transmembrane sensor
LAKDRKVDQDFDALKREATNWIIRLTSGSATAADADALTRWRNMSDANERAFKQAASNWKMLGHALNARSSKSKGMLTRRRLLTAGGLAAGSVGVTLGLVQLGILPSFDMLFADFATGVGEQKTVRLPDGSTVVLDGGTALSLAFSQSERRATLSAGAAVFELAQEPRPFRLAAGAGETRGSDASFSIGIGEEEVAIDCVRGHISVDCRGSDELVAGEGVSYSTDGLGLKLKTNIETIAAWRRGLLIFKDRTVSDVVLDLNRHRKGKVLIASRTLSRHRVSGVFHLDRPNEVLSHLEATLQTRPVDLPGGLVLLL